MLLHAASMSEEIRESNCNMADGGAIETEPSRGAAILVSAEKKNRAIIAPAPHFKDRSC
jgi:hypothetical protein